MDWLKEHEFLAAWLGPLLSIALAFVNADWKYSRINKFQTIIYFSFTVCLAIAFTPTMDADSRSYAKYLLTGFLTVIIVTRHEK
ncbi:MAG TPA: hypothetical protein VNH18_17890 [Bryobacteraceae bacterium]|nr:hypothetical protein [Bryobacteraceae bacterium]